MGGTLKFERTDPFTLAVWIKSVIAPDSTEYQIIGNQNDSGPNEQGYALSISPGNFLRGKLCSNEFASQCIDKRFGWDFNVTNGSWHLLIMTYDGSTDESGLKLYHDNIPFTVQAIDMNMLTGSIVPLSGDFCLASRNSGDRFFPSKLAGASAWNKEFSQTEVNELFTGSGMANLFALSTAANLVSWWCERPGDFPTLPDIASGNDGTLQNMDVGDYFLDVPG